MLLLKEIQELRFRQKCSTPKLWNLQEYHSVFPSVSKKVGHFLFMCFWLCLCHSTEWDEEIPEEGQIEVFPTTAAVWLFQCVAYTLNKLFWCCRNSVLSILSGKSFLISVKDSYSSNGCFSERKNKNLPKFPTWLLLLMLGECMVFFIK